MTWIFFDSPQNHTSQGQPKNKSDVFSLISHILEDELFQKNTITIVVSNDNEWNDYVDQIVKLMRNLKTDYKDYQMKS